MTAEEHAETIKAAADTYRQAVEAAEAAGYQVAVMTEPVIDADGCHAPSTNGVVVRLRQGDWSLRR